MEAVPGKTAQMPPYNCGTCCGGAGVEKTSLLALQVFHLPAREGGYQAFPEVRVELHHPARHTGAG